MLANIEPTGTYLMEDFYFAGGVQAVINELLPHLHGDAPTINGRSIAQNAAESPSTNPDVIRPLSSPLQPRSAHVVLRGSLAPRGAVIKRSAASPHLLRHRGPALVFEDIYDLAARVDDPDLDITRDSVMVLRNGGPIGAPGFPQFGTMPIPAKLLREGVEDIVRISDSRISGTSFGTLVVHVAPEWQSGGQSGSCGRAIRSCSMPRRTASTSTSGPTSSRGGERPFSLPSRPTSAATARSSSSASCRLPTGPISTFSAISMARSPTLFHCCS